MFCRISNVVGADDERRLLGEFRTPGFCFITLTKEYPEVYRTYDCDRSGKIITAPKIIEADTDDDAIAQIPALVDKYDIELWESARMVVRIHPDWRRILKTKHPENEKLRF